MNKLVNRLYSTYFCIKSFFSSKLSIGKLFRIDKSSVFERLPTAYVDIGQKVVIRRLCTFKIREGAIFKIGNRVAFNDGCNITVRKQVIIGDDVLFGPNVVIVDHDHDYHSLKWKDSFIEEGIYIGNNVWVGANVVILKGSYIGDNSVIAAGTVIKGQVEQNKLFYEKKEQEQRLFERN